MQDFKSEIIKIQEVGLALKQIQDTLDETYKKALDLKGLLENKDCWSGEAHKVGEAFLALTIQYHGMLAGAENRPVEQAYEGLDAYLEADGEFYDTWEKYQELLQI